MQKLEFDVGALLERIKAGDESAFEELIGRYEPLMISSVRRVLAKQPSLAEEESEMLQEARCALYRASLSYSTKQSGVTFGLYAEICIRNGLTSKFLRRVGKSLYSLESMEESGEGVASPLEDALETLIQNESVALLYSIISSALSPLEYEVFRMHEEGLSTSEIGEKLSRPQKSVENALARAVKKLRRLLSSESI